MIIFGCFGGTTILGNTHMFHSSFAKQIIPVIQDQDLLWGILATVTKKRQETKPMRITYKFLMSWDFYGQDGKLLIY